MKSAHQVIHLMQSTTTEPSCSKWSQLWSSSLHPRHQLIFWRVLSNNLPTHDRLQRFMAIPGCLCYLCNGHTESLSHLFVSCPLTIMIWANSPWQLQVEHLIRPSLIEWILGILQPHSKFISSGIDKEEFIHFVVVAFENVWRSRNET